MVPVRNHPGLALTRALGDTATGEFGVVAEPEVTTHLVQPGRDRLLLLGTDGFFEFCPPQEVSTELLQQGVRIDVLEALCAESQQRWARNSYNRTCDDASAIAVSLKA